MSYVAGAGLLGETGAMANAVVLAYNSWATGAIYIRVQNQDGSVAFHDWDPITAIYIPGDRVPMAVGISMAWPPKHSLPGSQRKLIMVGQTNEDGLVYISGNTFSNGVYNHAGWSNFVPMQLPGAGALVVAATTVDSIAFPTRPCTSRNTTARRVDGARGRGPRAARSCPVSPAI
jgi:hypothetical protein